MTYVVTLRNAAAREIVRTVAARTGNVAAGRVERALTRETGERWYVVRCDPR